MLPETCTAFILDIAHSGQESAITSIIVDNVGNIDPVDIEIKKRLMLRITVLSLLLGALALIAGLSLSWPPSTVAGRQVPPVTLSAAGTDAVEAGLGTLSNGALQLELSAAGIGVVSLWREQMEASDYPFLHLAIEDAPRDPKVLIEWKNGDGEQKKYSYAVEDYSRQSLWLATNELKGWTGTISSLSLTIVGQAGKVVRIRDFSLYPASPSRKLRAIYSDLTSYVPWNRAEMNSHTGVTQVSSFYPVPLIVAFLILSLLGYGSLLLLFRAKLAFNWRVVALIFLACWITLDLSWQNRLLHQVADTYRTFSGKTTPEKLAVGPDAKLYKFISAAKPLLEPKEARIFVSSSDIYRGQRSAYFLYPFNVYWPDPGSAFPDDSFLRSGDYIVMIQPTVLLFNPFAKKLTVPDCCTLNAELILSDRTGIVVRVN